VQQTRRRTEGLSAVEKNNDHDGGIEVRCVETPEGVLTVDIRTLTDEELERLLAKPRRAPKRVH
jgi:hypothetical protein